MQDSALLTTLRELEVTLHRPDARADPAKLGALLHPSFREIGRSGREWSREETLREFAGAPQSYQVWAQDFRVETLAPEFALLTYRSAHMDSAGFLFRHTSRASLWQLTPSGWKMRFHQGTPTGEFEKHAT